MLRKMIVVFILSVGLISNANAELNPIQEHMLDYVAKNLVVLEVPSLVDKYGEITYKRHFQSMFMIGGDSSEWLEKLKNKIQLLSDGDTDLLEVSPLVEFNFPCGDIIFEEVSKEWGAKYYILIDGEKCIKVPFNSGAFK